MMTYMSRNALIGEYLNRLICLQAIDLGLVAKKPISSQFACVRKSSIKKVDSLIKQPTFGDATTGFPAK